MRIVVHQIKNEIFHESNINITYNVSLIQIYWNQIFFDVDILFIYFFFGEKRFMKTKRHLILIVHLIAK